MANYTITVSSESEYVGPPLYVIYSTSMQPNITMQVGDTLTVTYIRYAGGQSSVTINNWDSGLWNDTSSIVLNDGDSVVRTAIAAGSDQIVADFPSSSFPDRNRIVTIESTAIVEPDTAITVSPAGNFTIGYNDSSVAFDVADAGTGTQYRLLKGTTQVDIENTADDEFTLDTTSIPSAGGSSTYKIQARVPIANNGTGDWVDAHTATVSRGAAPASSGQIRNINVIYATRTTDQTLNLYIDDTISFYVSGLTSGGYYTISDTNCTAVPASGYIQTGTVQSNVTPTAAGSYNFRFTATGYDVTVSGTVSDPYLVTNVTIASSTGNDPGATVESQSKTFDTLREGETLDFSVTSGKLEKNDSGTWETSGTIDDGDTYRLRRDASSSYSTNVSCTVTFSKNSVNKRSESFTVGTRAQDTYPASYNLGGPVSFAALNSYKYSSTITVTAIDSDAAPAISISGTDAVYQINGGAWTSTAGTVALNDTVRVRQRAAGTYSTSRTANLNIGGRTDTYIVNSKIFIPNLANASNVNPSTVVTRNFTVACPSYGSVTFTATNCELSSDQSTWVSSLSRTDGQAVYIRATSGANYEDVVTCTVAGGGDSESFTITTRQEDTTPDAFTLGSDSGLARSANSPVSDTAVISGMDAGATTTASITGSTGKEFRYKTSLTDTTWSAFRSTDLTGVTNGYQFQVRVDVSSSFNTATTATLAVGITSATYTATSEVEVLPDTTGVTITPDDILFLAEDFTATIAGGSSATTYQVRTGSYTGTVRGTATGNGSINVDHQPATSGTTYYITAFVSDQNNGSETISNVSTFTATRNSQVVADSAITVTPSGNLATTSEGMLVSVSNANGVTATRYRVLQDGVVKGTYNGTATSFTFDWEHGLSDGDDAVIKVQAIVLDTDNGDGVWVDAHTFTVTYSFIQVNGTTYTKNYTDSTTYTQYSQNVYLDDKIQLNWDPANGDLNSSWGVQEIAGASLVTHIPNSGYFHSSHSYAVAIQATFTGTGSYDFIFHKGTYNTTNRRVRFSGTISDPYIVDSITSLGSSTAQVPGSTNIESAERTFQTARHGETLDFSISNGELEKNDSGTWEASGTITGGDTFKLRGDAPTVYNSQIGVQATFTRNGVDKHTNPILFFIPSESLTKPTDIVFSSDDNQGTTVTVTVTASGGTNGTLQVSDDNATWVANGSTFTHTRGHTETYYARRLGVLNLATTSYPENFSVYPTEPSLSISVDNSDNDSDETTVTVDASGGLGGTLKVSDTSNSGYAVPPQSYTQGRGSADAHTYYAIREGRDVDSTKDTQLITVDYLAPKSFSLFNFANLQYNQAEEEFSIGVLSADHRYRVVQGSTEVDLYTSTGETYEYGTLTIDGIYRPSPGDSKTYTIQAERATSIGGSGSWVTTHTQTISMSHQTPTLSISVDRDDTDDNVPILVVASSIGADEFRFKKGSGNWSAWQSSNEYIFDVDRGDTDDYYVDARSDYPATIQEDAPFTVPYLEPDTSATVAETSVSVGSNVTQYTQAVTGIADYERVRITSSVGTYTASTDGNESIIVGTPADGASATYTVQVRRNEASGGDGTTWFDTNATFTITRAGNTAPIIGSFVASPSTLEGSGTVTLTATSVSDTDGTISALTISNVSGLSTTLATPTVTGLNTNNASISTSFTVDGTQTGTITFECVATDDDGATTSSFLIVNLFETGSGGGQVVADDADYGLRVYGPAPDNEIWLDISDFLPRFVTVAEGTIAANASTALVNIPSYVGDKEITAIRLDYPAWNTASECNSLSAVKAGTLAAPQLRVSRAFACSAAQTFKYLVVLDKGDQIPLPDIGIPPAT